MDCGCATWLIRVFYQLGLTPPLGPRWLRDAIFTAAQLFLPALYQARHLPLVPQTRCCLRRKPLPRHLQLSSAQISGLGQVPRLPVSTHCQQPTRGPADAIRCGVPSHLCPWDRQEWSQKPQVCAETRQWHTEYPTLRPGL